MTEPFVFRINGTPRPKARPRFVKGRVVTTAKETEKLWKNWLMRAVKDAVANRGDPAPLFSAAVRVTMCFTFEPPASARDRIGKPHTHKPDKDNLEKLVLDVMVKAGVLKDDSLVADGPVQKVWGERAGVIVLTEQIDAELQPAPATATEDDPPAWLAASG